MASEGPRSASAATNVSTTWNSWSNPSQSLSNDSVYAVCTITVPNGAFRTTDRLDWSGFGFSIPADAAVVGVAGAIQGTASHAGGGFDISSSLGYKLLNDTGTPVGSAQVQSGGSWGTTETQRTIPAFNPTTSTWGATLTPAIVNSSNFGFALLGHQFTNFTNFLTSMSMSIDYVSLTVYYELPSGAPGSQTRQLHVNAAYRM